MMAEAQSRRYQAISMEPKNIKEQKPSLEAAQAKQPATRPDQEADREKSPDQVVKFLKPIGVVSLLTLLIAVSVIQIIGKKHPAIPPEDYSLVTTLLSFLFSLAACKLFYCIKSRAGIK
ncbi:MAG: hypothetical protein JXA07_07010 [Spirochaetes bacterium]|nr:hypothetical protein [Spirochaetota bacterium]